jgi:gluconate kinase
MNRPLMILGYANHGKTTVAHFIVEHFNLRFVDTSEFIAKNIMVAKGYYSDIEQAFSKKTQDRALWYREVQNYNEEDAAALVKALLKDSDIYVGLRDKRELKKTVADIDPFIVWILDERKPKESTDSCTVSQEMAHIIVKNNGTEQELKQQLIELLTEPKGDSKVIKLKSFNLKSALNGEPVMLRDGSKAFVRHQETETFIRGNFNLVGIKEDHTNYLTWTTEGAYEEHIHDYDIISMYPKTRVINGFEVPAHETTKPDCGTTYFTPSLAHITMVVCHKWNNDDFGTRMLKRGIVFLNEEDAIANAKAMLGIDPYKKG